MMLGGVPAGRGRAEQLPCVAALWWQQSGSWDDFSGLLHGALESVSAT